jgi:hypothetical protein
MVNNSINKMNNLNDLSPPTTEHKKTVTNGVLKSGRGLGKAHKCGGVKPVNGILTIELDTNKQQNSVGDRVFQIFNHNNAFDVYKYDTALTLVYISYLNILSSVCYLNILC